MYAIAASTSSTGIIGKIGPNSSLYEQLDTLENAHADYALAHQRISIFDTPDHGRGDKPSRLVSLPAKSNGARRFCEQIVDAAEVRSADYVSDILRGSSAGGIKLVVPTNMRGTMFSMTFTRGLPKVRTHL